MTTSSNRVVMPWEHHVCEKCLKKNSYAVWLVWYGCFNRRDHPKSKQVVVVIDTDNIKLVQVRDLPGTQSARVKLCKEPMSCRYGDNCTRAHSTLELDCWTAIDKIQRTSEFLYYIA